MKIAFAFSLVALLAATGCAHHGPHHKSHREHHPYTHDARDHAEVKPAPAYADPAPSRDYTETYSGPSSPFPYPAPSATYSAPSPGTYTSTQTYTTTQYAAPTSPYSYAPAPQTYTSPPISDAAVTGPDTHTYVLFDTCMGRHANASGPLIGNLTGGTRYTCSGGPVATSGGVSYTTPASSYAYSSTYSISPVTSYSTAPETRQTYTYIPGQPSSGAYGVVPDPALQGAPEAPSAKPAPR